MALLIPAVIIRSGALPLNADAIAYKVLNETFDSLDTAKTGSHFSGPSFA